MAARAKSKTKSSRAGGVGRGGLAAIVLAAGKGTRMRSSRAKVLHEILGRPMGAYPIELARGLGAEPVVAVLGHQREAVEAALLERFGDGDLRVVEQTEQRGTGHAVRLAMPALKSFGGNLVMVLYGDVPLLRRETLEELVGTARRYKCLALVTATPPDPAGYGRILRDQRGNVIGVVEEKDASPEERAITEVNAGIYCGPTDFFREATAKLSARNAQGEYYLTDIIARAANSIGVTAVEADFRDVSGVNDRHQLAEAEAAMRQRINRTHMAHVTFRDPASTEVQPDVTIDVDVELGRSVALRGRTKIGHGARIGDGVILTDVEVGPGAVILPYTIADDASIGAGATVGPFARLPPGARLAARTVTAGTMVTTDVPDGRAAPSRTSQISKAGYAGKVAKKYTAPRKSG